MAFPQKWTQSFFFTGTWSRKVSQGTTLNGHISERMKRGRSQEREMIDRRGSVYAWRGVAVSNPTMTTRSPRQPMQDDMICLPIKGPPQWESTEYNFWVNKREPPQPLDIPMEKDRHACGIPGEIPEDDGNDNVAVLSLQCALIPTTVASP